MSLTLTHKPEFDDVWGKNYIVCFDVTFDASYPTGGEPIDAKDIGGGNILGMLQVNADADAADHQIRFVPSSSTAGNLQVNDSSGEVADTTDLSALTFRALFITY
jgi:hypothetical protein